MRFDILTLFPEYFEGPFRVSIIKRAIEAQKIAVVMTDLRPFGHGKHRKVDDRPYGGGPGMLMMPGPLTEAIRSVKQEKGRVIYLSPQGKPLTAAICQRLAKEEQIILLCGHYEGIDQRVIDGEVDEEISIGDYVLSSGCPAAVVLVDAISRFVPGVLGDEESAMKDSFQQGIFEGPQYTRPEEFEGMKVPAILTSGNHALIERWKQEKALEKTCSVRPELVGGSGRTFKE
jgi:tRNA (guanine37-N1)-methyltransferase